MTHPARFRIYYGDGSVYEGDPFQAVPHNVIAVAQEGRPVWYSRDFYYWHKEMGWVPCDEAGLWDYWLMYIGPKMALFGRNIRDDLYWQIVKRATAEGYG